MNNVLRGCLLLACCVAVLIGFAIFAELRSMPPGPGAILGPEVFLIGIGLPIAGLFGILFVISTFFKRENSSVARAN